MSSYSKSFVEKCEFCKDESDKIISAVYPMEQHLMEENNQRMMLGGAIETGLSRFDGLGIPLGLYLEPRTFSLQTEPKYNKLGVAEDSLFDSLLDRVTLKRTGQGTRKSPSSSTKGTRRNKKDSKQATTKKVHIEN
jgi:hypothetical protein